MATIQVINRSGDKIIKDCIPSNWINGNSTIVINDTLYEYFGEMYDLYGRGVFSTYMHPECPKNKITAYKEEILK